MEKQMPRRLGMGLLASMLFISAGCSNGSSAGNNTKNITNGNNSAKDTAPVTFTFFGADASPNWNRMEDDIGKEIVATTGVTLNAEYDVGSGGDRTKSQ